MPQLAFFDAEARQIYYTCNTGPAKFRLERRDARAGTDERGNRSTTLDADVDDVATGAGGPWVLGRDRTGSVLFRIDPATGRPAARTALRSVTQPMLATGDGAAWVVTNAQGPHLGLARVDGRNHEVRRFSVAYRRPPLNQSLISTFAVGLGGVWLHDGDRVLRLDPRTGRRTRTIRLAASTPAERFFPVCGQGGYEGVADRQSNIITLAADAVWVASNCGPRDEPFGFLQRIDPRTNRVTRVIALRHGYSAMAADRDGHLGRHPRPAGDPGPRRLQRTTRRRATTAPAEPAQRAAGGRSRGCPPARSAPSPSAAARPGSRKTASGRTQARRARCNESTRRAGADPPSCASSVRSASRSATAASGCSTRSRAR